MNRRNFVRALTGALGAVAALPAVAKAKASGSRVLVLPEEAAEGQFVTVVCLGKKKWATINHSPEMTSPWRIEEI